MPQRQMRVPQEADERASEADERASGADGRASEAGQGGLERCKGASQILPTNYLSPSVVVTEYDCLIDNAYYLGNFKGLPMSSLRVYSRKLLIRKIKSITLI